MNMLYKNPLALPAGSLRHAITIQEPTTGVDVGGNVPVWSSFATDVRAAIEPGKGTDLIKFGEDVSQTYITVTIRYMPGVTTQMQIISDNGSTYTIRSIENVLELNRVLVMTCIAVGVNE